MRSLNEFFVPLQNLNNIQNGFSGRDTPVPDDAILTSAYISVTGGNPLDSDVVVTAYRNYDDTATITLPNTLGAQLKAEEYHFTPQLNYARGDVLQMETDAAQTLTAGLSITLVFRR